MLLCPRRTKFRKQRKGRIHGVACKGTTLSFGSYGMKALQPARITARQLEATRRVIARHVRKIGSFWTRVFPDVPISTKPAEVRMGSGKGAPEYWAVRVKPGRILFEFDGVPEKLAEEIFRQASDKLPIAMKFVKLR